jgi:signal transduction histidine kinase
MKQTLLTMDGYLSLLVVLINLVYAIVVLARTSRARLYIVFFLICVSNIIWNFRDFLVFLTGDRGWYYMLLSGSTLLAALMFHFVNILVMSERKNQGWILLAYFLSGLLGLSPPFASVYPGMMDFVEKGFWNISYLILLGPFLIAGIVMLLCAFRGAKSADEKNRLRYILSAAVIGVFTGLTGLVQVFEVPVPPLGHLGCLVYSTILAVGVFKHRDDYDFLAEIRMKLDDMSQMAAGIAHEIRNPLTSIKGASDLLRKELNNLDHPKCRDYCCLIAEETERINNILDNFRYFTRPLKLEPDLVSINEVVQKTVRLAEVGALNLGIRLELCKDLPMVRADPSLMKQVFLNLIKNAAEACGSEGKVVIKTEKNPLFVKVSFADDGPGIPPEYLNRIFEPFFTTKSTGMGVGLAISQRIVQAHSGQIEASNLSPKGTEFSILLPF